MTNSATSTAAALPGFTVPGVEAPMSGMVLGTMTFDDTVDGAAAARRIDVAMGADITPVDTANDYAGWAYRRDAESAAAPPPRSHPAGDGGRSWTAQQWT